MKFQEGAKSSKQEEQQEQETSLSPFALPWSFLGLKLFAPHFVLPRGHSPHEESGSLEQQQKET